MDLVTEAVWCLLVRVFISYVLNVRINLTRDSSCLLNTYKCTSSKYLNEEKINLCTLSNAF